MKNNKVLIGIILSLLIILLLQSFYIFNLKKQSNRQIKNLILRNTSGKFSKRFNSLLNKNTNLFEKEWDPFSEMERLRREIDKIFEDTFNKGFLKGKFNFEKKFFEPDIDISETENQYILKMDIPGMEKDSINIQIKKGYITISGQREDKIEQNQSNYFYLKERRFGYFSRTIPLPEDADEKGIKVDYKKGVLNIVIPKTKKQQLDEKNIIRI
ncbi:MAG: Hsp20/alpha crystallin family protein [Candidatus Omnitrophica bacterium]|nr:Hsp20/alpha crystallin family protein [Candidatus Omnitrophota bacterium]MCM8831922.1 Hsp20/alpha crystallin family protein [Candidatus Omnitrophota bacterium]